MIDDPAMDKLDEAWLWYQATRDISQLMARLGGEYWAHLPWDGKMEGDPYFKDLEASQVGELSRKVLDSLGDVGVMVLFSAFEATVRDRVIAAIATDTSAVRHPASVQAMKSLNRAIDKGNFDRVLDYCKKLDDGMIRDAKRIRDYRNWVAHGRRGEQPADIAPDDAYRLLRRFLDRLSGIA